MKSSVRISKESLLRLSPVRQMMTDENFRFIPRGVDNHWIYNHVIPIRVTGFNPFLNGAFTAKRSALAEWIGAPWNSARLLNQDDELVHEVLFAVHDYLHFWSARAICELVPELGFGTRPITPKNLEDFAFCHLVTEAAATAGLDYWYLCTMDLNDECDIGSTRKNLTVSYRIEDEPEYRKFNPGFSAQRPEFFEWLVELYTSGKPSGFDSTAMHDSPKIKRWLDKEIAYGATQREYSRAWLAYLSGGSVKDSEKSLSKPVNGTGSWKRALVRDVGDLLWTKIKKNENWKASGKFNPDEIWRSKAERSPDLRFVNLNRLPPGAAKKRMGASRGEEAKYEVAQQICQHHFDSFTQEQTEQIQELFSRERYDKIPRLLAKGRKVPSHPNEPRDVFVLG